MTATLKTVTILGALLAALGSFPGEAMAGECPADKVGKDVMKAGATAPSGVTDTVLGMVDLKNYGQPGRVLRTRRLVIEPGGVVPWHSHDERPAIITTIEGEITEYRSTCAVPITHVAGDVAAESGNLSHWWKNNSTKPVVLLSSDILTTEMMEKISRRQMRDDM